MGLLILHEDIRNDFEVKKKNLEQYKQYHIELQQNKKKYQSYYLDFLKRNIPLNQSQILKYSTMWFLGLCAEIMSVYYPLEESTFDKEMIYYSFYFHFPPSCIYLSKDIVKENMNSKFVPYYTIYLFWKLTWFHLIEEYLLQYSTIKIDGLVNNIIGRIDPSVRIPVLSRVVELQIILRSFFEFGYEYL